MFQLGEKSGKTKEKLFLNKMVVNEFFRKIDILYLDCFTLRLKVTRELWNDGLSDTCAPQSQAFKHLSPVGSIV